MDVSKVKKDSTNSNVVTKYCIIGNPIPLQRPRFSYGHVWDAQKKLKHEWGLQLQKQSTSQFFKAVPLHLEVDFYMPLPRIAISKRASFENRWHIIRPDTSNLIKWVEDAATGILYDDDCIIVSIQATKRYSQSPRTEFFFEEFTPAVQRRS